LIPAGTGLAYHDKRRAAKAGLAEIDLESIGNPSAVTFAEPLAEDSSSDDA